jgi:hypothetical protein
MNAAIGVKLRWTFDQLACNFLTAVSAIKIDDKSDADYFTAENELVEFLFIRLKFVKIDESESTQLDIQKKIRNSDKLNTVFILSKYLKSQSNATSSNPSRNPTPRKISWDLPTSCAVSVGGKKKTVKKPKKK